MKKNRFLAFTLIELMISLLIIACVAAVIYSVFSGGISAWKRGSDIKSFERNLRLVSEVMARELRNTFKFSSIPFEGTKNSVSFACLIENIFLGEKVPGYEVGRVSYFLNEANALCRKQQTYPEIFQEEDLGITREIISDVISLSFSYLGFDNKANKYIWIEIWQEIQEESEEEAAQVKTPNEENQDTEKDFGIPKAIKIDLELKGQPDNLIFTKTIMIPVGNDAEAQEQEAL